MVRNKNIGMAGRLLTLGFLVIVLLFGMQKANAQTTAGAYAMKLVITMPKGSEGETLAKTMPTNTKFSPCAATSKTDAVTFTATYNAVGAGGVVDADVYVLFYNPEGSIGSKYYSIVNRSILVARNSTTELTSNAATDIFLKKVDNPGGTITETVLGGFVTVTGLSAGTWQLVGIVAPAATVNFNDPTTWLAWDVATLVLRKPWMGSAQLACQ
jgi:hypothetical protein